MIKNPSDLNGLLGFCFGAGFDPNNIKDLACSFKSPRNHIHSYQGAKSRRQGSWKFRGVDIS
jgi:predicted nucleotide-binding protein